MGLHLIHTDEGYNRRHVVSKYTSHCIKLFII